MLMPALSAVFLPLLCAFIALSRRISVPAVQLLVVFSGIPSLLLSTLMPDQASVAVSWLFLEAHFGLDQLRQVFLLFTSLLWVVAGLYAGAYMEHDKGWHRFFFFYLLTMSGNLGLVLAEDAASFYSFFALMTFAGYGLVVHECTGESWRAGRVYLVMAIGGELLLLAGIFLSVATSGSLMLQEAGRAAAASIHRDLIILLVIGGFGVKAGAFLLHLWLPLAHPAAPTPASAVLSGAMIKAGLLGWLHFLPLGEVVLPGWSSFLITGGVAAALYAVIVGIAQPDPKVNLAYSSISQMGVMTIAVGIGLARPEAWPPAASVLIVYAFGHSLAKGALFLGVGVAGAVGDSTWKRRLVFGGLFLAAMAIAGAPLTGGAVAKKALKGVSEWAPAPWPLLLEWLLPLSAVGTTLLLGRFLFLMWLKMRAHETVDPKIYHVSLWWSWTFVLALVAAGVWLIVPFYAVAVDMPWFALAEMWDGTWPLMLGAGLLWVSWKLFRLEDLPFQLPPGDLLVVVEKAIRRVRSTGMKTLLTRPADWQINFMLYAEWLLKREDEKRILGRSEAYLLKWGTAGALFMFLILLLFALLLV
jgi:formate hydrogenlyase subunit 3/multisubunit Na+/H+ antiporter MnhD subunit